MTKWDTSLTNNLDNLAYQIDITATNSASVTGNPVAYTQLTPTVYLPQTGQTSSASRFSVGTGAEANCVTDNLTGLMWVKDLNTVMINSDPNGASTPWQNALDSIATANSGSGYCGHKDWYLPTINDLSSLANDEQTDPAAWLNTQGFSNVDAVDGYWSSSTLASDTYNNSWGVIFSCGCVVTSDKTNDGYVWPVRLVP